MPNPIVSVALLVALLLATWRTAAQEPPDFQRPQGRGHHFQRPPTQAVEQPRTPSTLPTIGDELGEGSSGPHARIGHTWMEVYFGIAILVFGLLTLAMLVFLASKRSLPNEWAFRLIGLALVVTAGLFLIVAGFSQEQMAGMMGLLGSAAGYILGKDVHPDARQSRSGATETPQS